MTRTLLFLAVAFAVLTQAPTTPGVIALTGARIIDGTGGAPLQQGIVVLNKGMIEAVGAPAALKIPPGATRVDLSGKTIIPGLINAHAHLNVQQGAKLPVRDDLIRRLKTYATYGVTSAVSLGSRPADELDGLKLRDEQTRIMLDRARLYTGVLMP
jgi:imidazolonepropionase-like amidohydrolase